ncbi:AraC-type DNA-binding domain-containing protein [Hoeflea phototrophica DFL-43]|uniref:AraC-type DNA-binding domain-containing protein n=1 Tax=Hoeflea phototrophica (strain DSM 17068 / NCIMB 14078 / DFL-43) TaxID=411684 RepID=A9DHH2_HOEPD|nr:helix-turn-helix domain-containing protein [Hoeflea phototrophica]EDQ31436.2 AraC-type DNA-binding domain-containing protein [Hoeflea phototrophica DFL-43]
MEWATAQFQPGDRYEAWRHALNDTHLPWSLGRPKSADFSASLRSLEVAGLSIIDCVCDPCHGSRDMRDIRSGDDGCFGVLMVRKGRERVEQGGEVVELSAGSTFIWDASRPISFEVLEPLEKCTLLVSRDMLKRETGLSELPVGVLDSSRGFGALLHERASGLGPVFADFDARDQVRLGSAMLMDLTHAVEGRLHPVAVAPRALLVQRINRIIDTRFADPGLDLSRVAESAGISLRYLHQVLEGAAETGSNRIVRRRLEALRHALAEPALASVSITQLGFASGFSSVTHISRTFRGHYGETPSAFRKKALSGSIL